MTNRNPKEMTFQSTNLFWKRERERKSIYCNHQINPEQEEKIMYIISVYKLTQMDIKKEEQDEIMKDHVHFRKSSKKSFSVHGRFCKIHWSSIENSENVELYPDVFSIVAGISVQHPRRNHRERRISFNSSYSKGFFNNL